MEEQRLYDMLQQLAEILLSLEKELAETRISLSALTAALASQIKPDDPEAGVQHIRELEAVARQRDPSAEKLQRASDILEAIKLQRKHGFFGA